MTSGADLSPHARRLLSLLMERGDWVNRVELAHILGKRRLSVQDTGAIERMADKGLIEMRVYRVPHQGLAVEYKAK